MKIAVCIKQVPASSDGNMDPVRGVLIRNGRKQVMNIYDASALETALRLKEGRTGTVDVFTMGPETAKQVLVDAYALGADEGYLISDKKFSGADSLATSFTLAQALKVKGPYDIILCGRQTTDGDTGQVGASLAAWLEIPYLGHVNKLEEALYESISVWQILGKERALTNVKFPCVLAVELDIFTPRMPALRLKLSAAKKSVITLSLKDMPVQNEQLYGLKGSPTRVKKIYTIEYPKAKQLFQSDPAAAADKMIAALNEWGLANG